ncbi:hypothetical protein A8C32_09910 [Flavivirga aquatica]|uniref:Uncharacterized protein n=1 Tax=Flavivirga aquatica TaxID=1849968 RepID=A0A1E5TEL4_9FLAO|nr:hypothetical protein [Flavivirga aquatica]OEK09816.1 hypothetical protein A8C32_09910 [Flavivirga aquatica]
MDKPHFLINWTDGVKINKDHFIESDFHNLDAMQDYAAIHLTTYNYGLLGAHTGHNESIKLSVDVNTEERLVVRLKYCNAITKKGCRVLFNSDMYGGDEPTATIESKNIDVNSNLDFLVVLSINPFKYVPVGEPDPESIPLHHPYALPKIDLHIMSKSQFNTSFLEKHYLMVGKIQWKNGAFVIDESYLPPISKIKYHTTLLAFHEKVSDVLVNLRNHSLVINNKNRHKFQNNKLAKNTFKLCLKVMDYVSDYIFKYTQTGEEKPPIFLVQSISVLGNYISTELAILEEEDREKLLQYYYEWIDIKPSVFEAMIGDVINLDYDHLDINEAIVKLDYFMTILERLWKKMSDLEYIGMRKDNIVISEDKVAPREVKKGNSWSIID